MKKILIFDHNNDPIGAGTFLAYTEDVNQNPVYNYADSLLVLGFYDAESVKLRTLIYNKSQGSIPEFASHNSEDTFNASIFKIVEDEYSIKIILTDHYKMDNQDSPNVEDLKHQLNVIRGIASN